MCTVDTGQKFENGRPKAYFFKAYPKVKNPKVWSFLRAPEDFAQMSEKFNFSKRTNTIVDHKFTSFAINWQKISI